MARIDYAPVNRERAMLEAFAEAVERREPFVIPPEEVLNSIAVLEAIEPAARSGVPVAIP